MNPSSLPLSLTVRTLAGGPFEIPRDLTSDRILLGIASLGPVSLPSALVSWRAFLRGVITSRPGVTFYWIFIASSRPFARRSIPDKARQLVGDPKLWPRTLWTTDDDRGLRNALAWTGDADAVLMVVDRQGEVLWQTREGASQELQEGLLGVL